MRRRLILGLMASAAVLTGCGDEDPTTIGSDLLGDGFRTFEVVLEAPSFLQRDTTYDRLGSINGAPFGLVANAFDGELFAHTLFRVNVPNQAVWNDTAGTQQVDTDFTVTGGTLTVVFDTLGDAAPPVDVELYPLTEGWDPFTVSWELRSDTAETPESWAEPGGTRGPLLASATWADGDTLRIPLDSTDVAIWTDSVAALRGGLIRSASPGTRARIQSIDLSLDLRPSTADTIVPGGSLASRVFVRTPAPDAPGPDELRVGGLPSWRSALHFRSLADVEIPCSPATTTCTLPLSDANLNLATLLLYPMPVQVHRIERPLRVEGRAAVGAPGVPLPRWALTAAFGNMQDALEPAAFTSDPAEPAVARVPITNYIRTNVTPPEDRDPLLWVALVATGEQASPVFGYGAFGSLSSASPPRLRLVVTVPVREEETP